jgi:hypothetical protein
MPLRDPVPTVVLGQSQCREGEVAEAHDFHKERVRAGVGGVNGISNASISGGEAHPLIPLSSSADERGILVFGVGYPGRRAGALAPATNRSPPSGAWEANSREVFGVEFRDFGGCRGSETQQGGIGIRGCRCGSVNSGQTGKAPFRGE